MKALPDNQGAFSFCARNGREITISRNAMQDIAKVREESEHVPLYDDFNFFSTYDLGLAAALISAEYELFAVDKWNPKKALFVFHREDGIEETADSYWADRLEVKARRYFDSLKAVKNKLYSSQ